MQDWVNQQPIGTELEDGRGSLATLALGPCCYPKGIKVLEAMDVL